MFADACFENLTFANLLSPFINTVLSFSNTMKYYLWLDSKYNGERRCDVLVQNKTIR